MPLKKLNELIPPQICTIVKVRGGGPLRQRMIDMGLVSGAEIKVIRCAPLGDPIEYQVKGYNLSLRKHEARHILVEVNSFPLSKTHPSKPVKLTQISGGWHFKKRVQDLGIHTGSVIHVRQNIQHGPMVIDLDNRSIKIGRGMAQKILVEPIE